MAFLSESRLPGHALKEKGNEQQAGSGRWVEERLSVLFKVQGIPTEGFSTGEGVRRDSVWPTPSIRVPFLGKSLFLERSVLISSNSIPTSLPSHSPPPPAEHLALAAADSKLNIDALSVGPPRDVDSIRKVEKTVIHTRSWRRGNRELIFNVYKVSVWGDEKVLGIASGGGCATL